MRSTQAVVWLEARNPLALELLVDGEPAPSGELGGITRWLLELRRFGQGVFIVDSAASPAAFVLEPAAARLTVDLSDVAGLPTGHFEVRLKSFDPSDDDPLVWVDGEVTLEVRA